MANLEMS